jgi:hypothetical protein
MSKRLSVSGHAAHRAGQSKRNGPIAAMPWSLALALSSAILGCALSALAAGSESRPRSVLANAPGLEQRVTYSETKIPLGEFVARVAADTGVALTAVRDVADEPVAVVVKEFPARELLEQLAELLDYRWSRRATTDDRRPTTAGDGNGSGAVVGGPSSVVKPFRYEIWQDLASRQREEALRRALSAGGEQRLQEELAICRELAGKSQEEMRRLWDESTHWNERLERLTPEERRVLENSPEFRRQELRHSHARRLWSPIKRSLAGLMTRLSREQWAALRTGRQLVLSSQPKRGELALPPELLRVFRTSRPTISPPGKTVSAEPNVEERARQREREGQERWDQAEQYDVIIRLFAFDTCWWDPAAIMFEARAVPVHGGERLEPRLGGSNYFNLYIGPEKAIPPTEEDPERRALLEQDPVLSVKKPFQPDARPIADPFFPGISRTGRLLPELLPDLACAYGVHFIADAYWGVAWRAGWASDRWSAAGARPLFEVLDSLTGRHHEWDRRGSLVRIRNRKWYLDRPREVPLRTVRRWAALYDRLGALPLEEAVAAATTLTDLQLEAVSILSESGVFPTQWNDLRSLVSSRSMLRLYARLSPAQRQALHAGQPLAMAQLSPALRSLVPAQLERVNRWREALLDVEQWGGGHVTLSRIPDVRIREQRGQSVTWRLASAPAPAVATRPDAVTRFPVTRLRFNIHYGAETPAAVGLIVAADAGGSARP